MDYVIQFICGLAFFLFGMNVLSHNLEGTIGERAKSIFQRVGRSRTLAFLLAVAVTVAVQSSSAVSVMLVSLVGSGVMRFSDTLYMLYGTNVGTTVTAWILSLTGIEETNIFIKLLKPENFTPFLALIGVLLIIASKKPRPKYIGSALAGFCVLIYGMRFMTQAVRPLAQSDEFSSLLIRFQNPVLSLLIGVLITAIVQSSSASVGILQAFAFSGTVPFSVALPVIFGQNIGTCVTALISAVGSTAAAKNVAKFHTLINTSAAIFCMLLYYILSVFIDFKNIFITPAQIAAAHTLFNIIMCALLMPFTKKISVWLTGKK